MIFSEKSATFRDHALIERDARAVLDLAQELAAHRFGEILVVPRRHHETVGSCLHVLAVIFFEVAHLVCNGKAIDDDAARQRHGPGLIDKHGEFTRHRFLPIARHIDNAALGGDAVRRDGSQRCRDPFTDGGGAGLVARESLDRRGETLGIFIARDEEPAGRVLGHLRLGPDNECDGDAFGRAGADRFPDGRIAEAIGNALKLEAEFIVIDAARGIGRQCQFEIGEFFRNRSPGAEADQDDQSEQAEHPFILGARRGVENFSPPGTIAGAAGLVY
jgi:hypothetical protein